MNTYLVAALYKFVPLDKPWLYQDTLRSLCTEHHIQGTLIVAEEGLNGTVAGQPDDIRAFLSDLREMSPFVDLEHKESWASAAPFRRMKVHLKKEIVTMKVDGVDPLEKVGTYIPPQQWNDLIADPDTLVIDTRNDYEYSIGTFEGAIDPDTKNFRDFPTWVENNQQRLASAQKIAMFCTGGIRCEKATSYLMTQGYDEVYHLKGGILKYLEEVPEAESTWQGSCFVFDGRVSVDHGLREGPHLLCHACRRPILPKDKERPEYEEGVSCHHCAHETTEADKTRFRERQKQMALSEARGERHIKIVHED